MGHKLSGGKLLNEKGELIEAGWATSLVKEYNPETVQRKMRLKEWDYYLVLNAEGDFGFASVQADIQYIGMRTATLFNFKEGTQLGYLVPRLMPRGYGNMPKTSVTGDITYKGAWGEMEYLIVDGGRKLRGKYKKNFLNTAMEFDIFLKEPPMDSMVIATPWTNVSDAFYYNQKINCMPASGYVKSEMGTFEFKPEKDFGTLDWGRGVWTYDNTWYWGSGNAVIDGKPFGFNIGYGFGDTSAASENMIFYDGKCHKFGRLFFEFDQDDLMKPWKIISSDGRFDMVFTPMYDNITNLSVAIIKQSAHQMFGKLNGKAILDDGTALDVKDVFMFNEQVHNKY